MRMGLLMELLEKGLAIDFESQECKRESPRCVISLINLLKGSVVPSSLNYFIRPFLKLLFDPIKEYVRQMFSLSFSEKSNTVF